MRTEDSRERRRTSNCPVRVPAELKPEKINTDKQIMMNESNICYKIGPT